MSTTAVDFVLQAKDAQTIYGANFEATPFVVAFDKTTALVVAGRVPGGAASSALGSNNGNFLVGGFSDQGFAKNGAFHVTTSGTTPVTVDLTNLATNSTSHAGDTVFATWNKITFMNCGPAAMTVGPGASSGNAFLTGTTPALPVAALSAQSITNLAGFTIDSTHKNITITPTAGGDIVIAVGGS